MEIRSLTPGYAVSAQIEPADVPGLKAAGFTTVICNRPDAEVPAELAAAALKIAVEAAGMRFVDNPVATTGASEVNIAAQAAALAGATGPVFAYCRSGHRSAVTWVLSQAGRTPAQTLITAAARGGYDLGSLRERIETLAGARS